MTSYILLSLFLVLLSVAACYLVFRNIHSRKVAEKNSGIEKLTAESTAAKADYQGRHDELRHSILEAQEREKQANERAIEADRKSADIAAQLRQEMEDKGRYKSEAVRAEELKNSLNERDGLVQLLNSRISNLEVQKAEAVRDAQSSKASCEELIAAERIAHERVLNAKDDQIQKLNEFIGQARAALTTEFKAVSADTLKQASAQLVAVTDEIIKNHGVQTSTDVKLHHQEIATLLKPVEETIKRLDKHVEESDTARARAETLLDDQMRRLAGASEALSNALRKPVVRGSWGEMTLENALENAGLEAEIDFLLQHSTETEDGKKRADAIINLPKGRKLIIDSKNLMETYLAMANCDNPTEKAALVELHSKSLKSHIKSLSAKEYWKRYDGLDCVILFIPHDGMYHAAIQDEAELIREASEKRVFIANPMSLIPLLKAVRYVLNQERLNQSAEEISKVGIDLYIQITRFAKNFAHLGDRLKSTVRAYNDAIPGLDLYILAKSRRLKQLGSGAGSDPELPELIELEPRIYSSGELRPTNRIEAIAASHEAEGSPSQKSTDLGENLS